MKLLAILAALGLVCLAGTQVEAAKFRKAKPKPVATQAAPAPPAAAVPVEPPPPPYEPQLLRLSELMGALAYLRDLCHAQDGELWREKMAAVISAEATTPARKEKLAGAFNKGFRGYEITYRNCTANAEAIVTRFIDEGARIAHEIGNRYNSS